MELEALGSNPSVLEANVKITTTNKQMRQLLSGGWGLGTVAAAEAHPLESTSENEVAAGKVPTCGPWT